VDLVDQTKIVLGEEKSKLLFLAGLNPVPKINAGTDLCSTLHCNVRLLMFNVKMQLSNTKLKKVLHWLASISFSTIFSNESTIHLKSQTGLKMEDFVGHFS
jgi:hypothetical protein